MMEAADRIQLLHEMLRRLSREPDPEAAADRYLEAMQEAYGPLGLAFAGVRDDPPGGYVITRLLAQDGTRPLECRDVWQGDADCPVHVGGLLGALFAGGEARLVTDLAVPHDAALGDLLRPYRSLMVLPIFDEGRIRHWLVLFHTDADYFRDLDLEVNVLRANTISGLLSQKRLNLELQRALRWIRDELDQIAMVQRSLLPKSMPDIPDLDVAARLDTYDQAGGDYYDFLRWQRPEDEDERWTWVVADASGHGPASAVLVAMLHVLLRALPAPTEGPSALLRQMNERLFDCPTCTNFMTAFVGCYRPAARELVFALAGHHPPLLRRPDGRVETLVVDADVPLGIVDRVDPPMAATRLDPGALLLLYTDGLVEARDPSDEQFGTERLVEALRTAEGPAQAVVDRLFAAVERHEAGRKPTDDKCAVAIRVA